MFVTIVIAILLLIAVFTAPWCTFWGRNAGGGLWAADMRAEYGSIGSRFGEAFFTLPIAIISTIIYGDLLNLSALQVAGWFAVAWAISYWSMEMGHGTVFNMKGYEDYPDEPDRVDGVEDVVRLFYRGDKYKPIYSWLCMGYKGLLIALPLGPTALLNAIAWPTGYWLGNVKEDNHASAELFSTLFAGTIAALTLAIYVIVKWII